MPAAARTMPTPDDRISQQVAVQLFCIANFVASDFLEIDASCGSRNANTG